MDWEVKWIGLVGCVVKKIKKTTKNTAKNIPVDNKLLVLC